MATTNKRNPLKWPLTCKAGIMTVLLYIVFLLIAWVLFPNPATPLDHWLSDFGRIYVPANGSPVWDPHTGKLYSGASQYNPGGIWYDLGCILGGIALFPFFAGLLKYKDEGESESQKKKIKILTYLLVILGFGSALSLIMVGIFYEDFGGGYSQVHHLWTMILFVLFLPIMGIMGFWAWLLKFKRFTSIYGWGIMIFDAIVIFTNNNLAIAEWIAVFSALGLVAMLVIGVYSKEFAQK
jgi:hypothetical protein